MLVLGVRAWLVLSLVLIALRVPAGVLESRFGCVVAIGLSRVCAALIHPGFCAGSKDGSKHGSYGHTNEGGDEVAPLL